MRTQRVQRLRRTRRWVAAPATALTGSLLFVAAAAAQGGGDAAVGSSGLSAALILGGAALLTLTAVLVGYVVPARRRRAMTSASARGEWELGVTQTDWPVPELGDSAELALRPRGVVPHTGMERALGYTTFPERKRAVSPESRYQARRIRAACEARGLILHQLVGDVESYSGPDLDRPGLNHALERLAAGEASCLVVAGLDRLSRSAANLGTVIEWLDEVGARLVVIDIDLDTDTDEGRLAARALARVGALERRTGAAATQQTQREPAPSRRGRAGRAALSDLPLLQRRIATMRAGGMTLQAIADTLNGEGVPTLRGGARWRPSSVQAATGYKRPGRPEAEKPREG